LEEGEPWLERLHVELGLEHRADGSSSCRGERAPRHRVRIPAERAGRGDGRCLGQGRQDAPFSRRQRPHAGDLNLDAPIAREAVGLGAIRDRFVGAASFDLDARRGQSRAQVLGDGLGAGGRQRVVVGEAVAMARGDRRLIGVPYDFNRELAHAAPLGRDAFELRAVTRIDLRLQRGEARRERVSVVTRRERVADALEL
jgi:hypothetical protein